jgi:type III pantothenate kinase
MILTVDVGNTNIVLGVWQGDKLQFVSRVQTDREKTRDSYAIEIRNILSLYEVSAKAIEGAIISSVVSQVSSPLANAIEMLCGKTPLIVGPGVKTGLNILIENPAQLGSDMVVDAVGAIAKYDKPLILIDLGTATKIFAVDKNNGFLGCSIMPGIMIGLEALSNRTATLPKIGLDPPREVIGRTSIDSMKSGSVYGTASMIDGMVERYEKALGQKATVVATGGFSGDIVRHCKRAVIHDPNLTLEGLYRVYIKNRDLF